MRRYVLIIAGVAALAWAVAAIVLDSASLKIGSSSKAAVASPPCDLSSPERSAQLPGTRVYASPAPGSGTASPHTQISFLGTSPGAITGLSVNGSASGHHVGHLAPYSQGDGASFLPAQPFRSGERVTVNATIGARAVSFSFAVDTPYSTAHVPQFPAGPAAPADTQSFITIPGIRAPVMTVTSADRDPAAGDLFLTNGPGPGQYGPLIYTPDGRLVWFLRLTGGETTAENLSVQSYQGQRVLTWWKGRVLSLGFGLGEDIVMNDRYQEIAHVAAGNGLKADLHDFQLVPGEVAYITAYNPIRCDLRPAGGKINGTITDVAVQEIDVRSGLVRWEWHSLDHVKPAESEVEVSGSAYPWDYVHLDSIDPQPDGRLLLSGRSTWAGYELEAGTGRILWRLGGSRSSFKMGRGTKMAWQHDGRMRPDGTVTFFDDGSNPPIHSQSRGLVIAPDLHTHTARLVKSYVHRDPPVLAASQGNMQTLPDGSVLIGYGGVPQVSQFAPDGSLLLDAHQPYDMTFYRAYRFPWTGRPAAAPAIAASANNTGEETIVHASWNGATGVASWRVLAGETPQALSAVATIPASGFESGTTLPHRYKYAAVQARDRAGRVMGTSATSRVIGFHAALLAAGGRPGA
jgi:Arylsulfotransferase (ASST)